MQLVLRDRTADRRAVLLIVDRHDPAQHGIARVETAVAEVAPEQPGQSVGSRFGDGIHLDAGRSALGRVEPVREVLELRDGILAVPGLISGPELGRDLLAVQIELELPGLTVVPVRQGCRGIGRGRAASRRQQRERHPVSPGHRQLLDLLRIDVAAQAGSSGVDERGFPRDRHGFRHAGQRHLQVDGDRLSHQQLEPGPRHRGKAGELRRDPVRADAHRDPKRAAHIGHRLERVPRRFVHDPHRDPGQHRARCVGDRPHQHRFLRRRCGGHRKDRAEQDHSSYQTRTHRDLLLTTWATTRETNERRQRT